MSHYSGFNYEEFYEFIVDFFEEDQTPEGKAAASELLTGGTGTSLVLDLPLSTPTPP